MTLLNYNKLTCDRKKHGLQLLTLDGVEMLNEAVIL